MSSNTHDNHHHDHAGDPQHAEDMERSHLIANDFINLANEQLTKGVSPMVIASALHDASANFTAFAHLHGAVHGLDAAAVAENFQQLLEFYDTRHRGAHRQTGLEALVEQVKDEQP